MLEHEKADTPFSEERIEFGRGEIVKIIPDHIRLDESTGEPAPPLVVVQGIGEDERLPWTLHAFAQADERVVIGVKYPGKLEGSAKLVEAPAVNTQVPEIDADQAGELIEALRAGGIEGPVDAVGVSRGAIRLVVAMRQHPERFRDVFLAHPAGQDDRGYTGAHLDAVRLAVAHQYRKSTGRVENHRPEDTVIPKGRGALNDPRGWRLEQKSVARARLHKELDDLAAEQPHLHVMMAGDKSDAAFRPERLRAAKGPAVTFLETDWGGHGIGFNLRAIQEVSDRFKQMERGRAETAA